jgi:hypothetical protein
MKKLALFISILMLILTSGALFVGLAILQANALNLLILGCMSAAGYATSYIYFLTYKSN